MKKLLGNVSISLHGTQQNCDLLLACYASSTRPCLMLMTAPTEKEKLDENSMFLSEPYAIATINPPPGYLHGFKQECFALKGWSENEGLLEQILPLVGEDGLPFFSRVRTRDGSSDLSILVGFCKAPIFVLENKALALYKEIVEDLHASGAIK